MGSRAWAFVAVIFLSHLAAAQQVPVFDFKDPKSIDEWKGNGDIAELTIDREGLVMVANGRDPFVTGPARDFPAGQLLSLHLRVKCEVGGELQVFYYKTGASEKDSIKADVSAEVWENLHLSLPALGPGYRLRIDPPGNSGKVTIASIRLERRELLPPPQWPLPGAINKRANSCVRLYPPPSACVTAS